MRTCLRKLRLLVGAVRLISAVLLVTLVGAMPANIATTYAELCCNDCDDEGSSEEHERDCDCPLGCRACCVGSVARAVVTPPGHVVVSPILESLPHSPVAFSRPPQGIARDILHVPKLAV